MSEQYLAKKKKNQLEMTLQKTYLCWPRKISNWQYILYPRIQPLSPKLADGSANLPISPSDLLSCACRSFTTALSLCILRRTDVGVNVLRLEP